MIEIVEDTEQGREKGYIGFQAWYQRMEYLRTKMIEQTKATNSLRKSIDELAAIVVKHLAIGPAPKSGAERPDITPKGRRLAAELKYAPEMTFQEMYAARDARWLNGKMYRGAKELMWQFKGMSPEDALHAAERECYWMNRHDAILWVAGILKYRLNPSFVDELCE